MLADPESNKYIDGVAVHWYADQGVGPEILTQTHDLDPSKFILYTEGCAGNGLLNNKLKIISSVIFTIFLKPFYYWLCDKYNLILSPVIYSYCD